MTSKKALRRRIDELEREVAALRYPYIDPPVLPGTVTITTSGTTSCCACSSAPCGPNHAHYYCQWHRGGWVIS